MLLSIDNEILRKYPQTEIGYLVAKVSIKEKDPFVENLKANLLENLQKINLNATNFVAHPDIAVWRTIYEEDFGVKAKTYRSSIEALLRRVVTGKGLWNICNVVDLYNCCSISSLLPMGGYDLSKIEGDVTIRYAKDGERFQGLGEREKIEAQSHHVVYADHKRVICWLWNHKDSIETCIEEGTKEVLFFIDSAKPTQHQTVKMALDSLWDHLEKIECVPLHSGILNATGPHTQLTI